MPARPPFAVGAIYHVINRGVDKRVIFMKTQDYARFILGLHFFNDRNSECDIWTNLQNKKEQTLSILGRPGGPNRTNILAEVETKDERERLVDILVFALMPNHYHLIIREISEGGISAFMQKMGGYAWYFNKQYDRSGTLFQGRYKAVPIQDEMQLGNVFTYVHTNPVGLKEPEWKDLKVKNAQNALNWLATYRWSSYHDYIGKPSFPTVTERSFFLDFYGGEQSCRQAVEDWVTFKAENARLGPEIIE